MKIELEDGKYTVVQDDRGFRALRYGEEWRDLTEDNLIFCLASELVEAREKIARLERLAVEFNH